jgi:hypothetical protein
VVVLKHFVWGKTSYEVCAVLLAKGAADLRAPVDRASFPASGFDLPATKAGDTWFFWFYPDSDTPGSAEATGVLSISTIPFF